MNLPTILNVAIGLVVLYFLLSTIASLILEVITTWARYREEILFVTINRLLAGQPDRPWNLHELLRDRVGERLTEIPVLRWLGRWLKKPYKLGEPGKAPGDDSDDIVQRFWAHPKIKSLAAPGTVAPPAMEPATFARTLIDVVVPRDAVGALPDNPLALDRALAAPQAACPAALRLTLRKLADGGDIPRTATGDAMWTAFSANVARWFEEAGKRSTEEYRDTMRTLLLVIGFILAFALNADTVRTIQLLSRDRSLQETTAAFAATVVAQREQAAGQDVQAVADTKILRQKLSDDIDQLRELEALGFPLGWRGPDLGFYQLDFMLQVPVSTALRSELWLFLLFLLLKLAGLGATALAVGQGGPFWYDLMNKLVGLKKGQSAEADEKEKKHADQKAGAGSAPASATAAALRPLEIGHDLAAPGPGFDARKAYWLSQAAEAAYLSEAEVRTLVVDTWKFHDFRFFDAGGTQAFCACDDHIVLIAFRGTELKQIEDIRADTRTRLQPWEAQKAQEAHEGFQAALKHVHTELDAVVSQWLAPVEGKSLRRILLTGHSLGGALATLCFARTAAGIAAANAATKKQANAQKIATPRLASLPLLYTFGCPRVGNDVFTRALDAAYPGHVFRLVNENDIVPELPPFPVYHHAGHTLHFLPKGAWSTHISGLGRILDFASEAAKSFKDAGKQALDDHAIHRYVARCKQLVQESPEARP